MYSNTHNEEGKGYRRRSGRSSKRSSRSDTVDNDLVSQRASRNEDDRKARKARQKVELRAKQLNNMNEGATPGNGGSISALECGPSQVGYGCIHGDGAVTSPLHPPYKASSKTVMGHDQNMRLASERPWIGDLIDVQYKRATGDEEIQENIERLRVSSTPPPHGRECTLREVSSQHCWGRWGRVFAERGTPLSRIGTEASQPPSSSLNTPPLQRRAAVRRRRMHTSDMAITITTNLEGLAANKRLPLHNTDSGAIDNGFDVSPATTRGSTCWDSPNIVVPATTIPQESKTLPLHYRLPLTPTNTSPLGDAPGRSIAGLPRAQDSSLSVPNSPAFHPLDLAYQPRTPNLALPDSSSRNYSHNSAGRYTYRSRSASPMVHDHEPRLRAINQSTVLQRSIDTISPSHGADSGHDATRHTSLGIGYPGCIPGSQNTAMAGDDSRSHARKSSQGGRVVKFQCVLCVDKYRVNKMIQAPNCMHFLCSTCVKGICLEAPSQRTITNVLARQVYFGEQFATPKMHFQSNAAMRIFQLRPYLGYYQAPNAPSTADWLRTTIFLSIAHTVISQLVEKSFLHFRLAVIQGLNA
ncbi:hypothetical protein BGX38DRAFT_1145843 [Terfezia claveryi]|nr:hypothetical protein BGX38DRAFT_1145843 [Terfezia claveryi]